MSPSISNQITQMLLDMLDRDGTTEIRRNDLAQSLGCVPSQINYVISSRFTPERGYIVESRRGGGGYVKITRVSLDFPTAVMHAVNSVGSAIDPLAARSCIMNLLSREIIDRNDARLIAAAVDENALRPVPPEYRDTVRASILKQMLLACSNNRKG